MYSAIRDGKIKASDGTIGQASAAWVNDELDDDVLGQPEDMVGEVGLERELSELHVEPGDDGEDQVPLEQLQNEEQLPEL